MNAIKGSTKTVDALLASELNNMTAEGRTRVFEDIHGVAESPQEELSIEKLKENLALLSEAIDAIETKPAYDEAQRIASENGAHSFVNDDIYRLKFLRAESFVPKKAAKRMVNNLDLVYRYLGQTGLQRPICISDLDDDSLAIMKSGSVQLLPSRDRSGRRILVRIGPLGMDFLSNENGMMKTLLYILNCLSEDLESQRLGFVMISFPSVDCDPSSISNPTSKRLILECLNSVGVRISAHHICFQDTPWFRALGGLMMLASTPSVLVRTRLHYGSIVECRHDLMSFGIPIDQLPIKNSGTIKTKNQKRWLSFREMKDKAIENGEVDSMLEIFCPSTWDVLAIGGTHFYKFPGNCRYREILESRLSDYDNANSVHEKMRITNEVLSTIKGSGGRFLVKNNKGWWVPANNDTARIKVSNALRDVRKSFRARQSLKRLKSDSDKLSAKVPRKYTCCD